MTDTTNGLAILPNVPISLHPGSLGNIAPALSQEGTPGARALSIAQAALTTSYTAYAKVEEAVGSLPLGDEVRMVNGRPTKLAGGAVDQLVAATEGASKRVLSVVQKNYEELGKIEQTLDQQVAAAIDDPARKTPVGLSVATEIRAHVKALPDGKRATFAYAAVEAGDKQTVAALLHAPPYLSGLTDKQMAALRQRAAHAFAPVETTQLEAVRNAADMVASAARVALGRGPSRELLERVRRGQIVFDPPIQVCGRDVRDVRAKAMPSRKPVKYVNREGATLRPCLCCRQPFESSGPGNRMCDGCRGRNVSPFEPG